ncbi:nucleotidyltransferase [Companilactobacillus halodurans]|uniref:tRNA(Met) cytidine acetate ligase n=1 Tax=Companilactobacillus halodurans TaxID=2584183 RepID=A0A5P0ZVX1_9LACO|nr:nucleotidyltransferase [Companilactobacillus halodurans]MQS76496.1 nucleotidyltransferase [Companilactobacillus halodurans]MQS97055.1 nucleotidyltransferase [Companilactobacillus halodurans]
MTKIYGFVAEFNPFHNGHKLFIDAIKQKYHPDVLIAVMSGNFVQRGDFAILDKWKRARLAIENGVDLVVELPLASAVQPAGLFAEGSIRVLNSLDIDTLVFGTEEKLDFDEIAQQISSIKADFKPNYQNSSAQNLTDFYRSKGLEISKLPNQLLGLNYVLQIKQNHFLIDTKTILRNQSDFSATKVRNCYINGEPIAGLVPKLTQTLMSEQKIATWEDFFPYLKYQILNSSIDELQQIYQMVEGLEYKLKKEIVDSDNFQQFIDRVKSKRYTLARLRRLMMYTLLNVKESEINNVNKNPYLRILGFNSSGQKYLNELKKNDLNLITRVGKKEQAALDLEIRADRIYQMITKEKQDFGRIPYMKGVN